MISLEPFQVVLGVLVGGRWDSSCAAGEPTGALWPPCPLSQDSKVRCSRAVGTGPLWVAEQYTRLFSRPFFFLSVCFPVFTHKDL